MKAFCPNCGKEHDVFDTHQSYAGASRWAKLTKEQRSAALRKAARARWAKVEAEKEKENKQ